MTQYVAFLRAINVGGRMVKMDDLKKIMAMPGIKNIAAYIQSGNLIFDSTEDDKDALVRKIEARLLKSLGFEVKTLLRSMAEMEAIVKQAPYKTIPEDMGLHVTFLSADVEKELVKPLLDLQSATEQLHVAGSEVYLLIKKGAYGEAKLSNAFLEKKLKVAATTRNWATVNKMLEYRNG